MVQTTAVRDGAHHDNDSHDTTASTSTSALISATQTRSNLSCAFNWTSRWTSPSRLGLDLLLRSWVSTSTPTLLRTVSHRVFFRSGQQGRTYSPINDFPAPRGRLQVAKASQISQFAAQSQQRFLNLQLNCSGARMPCLLTPP